jgi:DNA-binding transcriptional MerR regulator
MGISKVEFVEAVARTFGSYHITPKDLGITSRQVNYWKQSIGLPYFQDEKHLKMNLYQALWLEILHSLSKMGISTKQLDALSRKVWLEPKEMGYYRNLVLAEIKHPIGSISEKDQLHCILEDPLQGIFKNAV